MLSTEEIANFRSLVELTLFHKYTKEAVADGTDDDWRADTNTYGSAVVDIPCNYLSEETVTVEQSETARILAPTLKITHTDTLTIGDRVTNIKDSAGTVIEVGPLFVQDIEIAAGTGEIVARISTLRRVAVV